MKKYLSLFLLAFVVVVATVLSRFIDVGVAEAQQAQERSSKLQQWEYASVYISTSAVRKNSIRVHVYTYYFQDAGSKRELFELEGEPIATWGDATAKALSKLGNEGWDMILLNNNDSNGALTFYFKRPKTVS